MVARGCGGESGGSEAASQVVGWLSGRLVVGVGGSGGRVAEC